MSRIERFQELSEKVRCEAKQIPFDGREGSLRYGVPCGTLRGLIPLGPTSCISKRKWPLISYGYGKGSPTESTFLRFT